MKKPHDRHRLTDEAPPLTWSTAPGRADDTEDDTFQREIWGALEIHQRIGHGSFGDVYRAFDPTLQRDVALKLLRPSKPDPSSRKATLLQEARRLARVRHPNVLAVHGVAEHEGRAGFWTDFIQGTTLQDHVSAHGPLGAHEAALVGIDLCKALAALHAAGIVHADVKPANVMREQGGRIVLMDFGSAGDFGDRPEFDDGIRGTPLLMAPELLLNRATPSPITDVYSLGVALYWLVVGRYPVEAETLEGVIEKHRNGAINRLRNARAELPTSFVQVVERAMSATTPERYANVGEMESALAQVLAIPAPRSVAGTRTHDTRRRRVYGSLGVVAISGLVAWGVISSRAGRDLRVEAAFYRQVGEATELLQEGHEIEPGDRLFLEIEGSQPMHVYVMNEDAQGEFFVMYPQEEESSRSLEPDVRHRLPPAPGPNRKSWQVTSEGGRESILVVASTKPMPGLERDLLALQQAEDRGIGAVVEEALGQQGERLTALEKRYAGSRGVWTWRIHVRNMKRQEP